MMPDRTCTSFSLPLLLLILPFHTFAQVSLSFSNYPLASQQCLYNAADNSGCPTEAATIYDINSCLCANEGNFITNSATCVADNDAADLQDVWDNMVDACSASLTPVEYSESDFLSAGQTSSFSSVLPSQPSISATASAPVPSASSANSQSIPPPPPAFSASSQVSLVESQTLKTTTSKSTPTTLTPSSTTSTPTETDANTDSNGNNVGHLSGGMIALIGSISGVIAVVTGVFVCCGIAKSPRFR